MNNETGVACAKRPETQRAIMDELDTLREVINQIDQATSHLQNRLDPVVAKAECVQRSQDETPRTGVSTVAVIISDCRGQLSGILYRLQAVAEDMEL